MVIDIINIERLALGEAENHTPVGTNRYRPKAFQLALERMQPEARQVHISDRTCSIKARENVPQLFGVFPYHATGSSSS
jgi:hypothetical protein